MKSEDLGYEISDLDRLLIIYSNGVRLYNYMNEEGKKKTRQSMLGISIYLNSQESDPVNNKKLAAVFEKAALSMT